MELAIITGWIDPYLGTAAAHQRGIGLERSRHFLKVATQLDQQAVAFVAFEKLVFFCNIGNRAHGAPLAGWAAAVHVPQPDKPPGRVNA